MYIYISTNICIYGACVNKYRCYIRMYIYVKYEYEEEIYILASKDKMSEFTS